MPYNRDTSGELHPLPLCQGFETRAGNGAEVGEHVRAGLLGDEAKTLGFVEPLNGTFTHADCSIVSVKKLNPDSEVTASKQE